MAQFSRCAAAAFETCSFSCSCFSLNKSMVSKTSHSPRPAPRYRADFAVDIKVRYRTSLSMDGIAFPSTR